MEILKRLHLHNDYQKLTLSLIHAWFYSVYLKCLSHAFADIFTCILYINNVYTALYLY